MRAPLASLALFALLSACTQKDGSTNDSSPSTDANRAPTANAGTDQTVAGDATVSLSGAGSIDPDGDALTYIWSFDHVPSGSTITSREAPFSANHSTEAGTTFVPDVQGTYVVSLVVRDPAGAPSAPDYVIVNVGSPNEWPVANAGADQTVSTGATVNVSGTSSYDPQGRPLTYSWLVVEKPAASSLTAVADAASVSTSFVADAKGVYVLGLTVNNGLVTSAADTMTVTATAADNSPVANAGADIDTPDCTTINLDCGNSSDPDLDELSYFWEVQLKPAASNVGATTFSDRNSATPTFYPDQAGTYVLTCAVSDGTNWSTPDSVTLNVTERTFNSAPSVNAGADQSVDAGSATCEQSGYVFNCDECGDQTVALGADAVVTDADGDPYTVQWEVIEGDAVIANAASLSTTVKLQNLEPEEPGVCEQIEHRFRLTVTDCTGASSSDVVIYEASCCGVEDTSSR